MLSTPPIRLMILDPGHFHAALVQKFMYDDVDPTVHVYAPAGPDLDDYLARIDRFNNRPENPTRWKSIVHTGEDFFQQMLREKPGNLVVLSGNNAHKADYILESIEARLNVLADKPMAIVPSDLPKLEVAFALAEENRLLLYDIMTERFEITTMLQRELSRIPDLFGHLVPGSPDAPAISKESVHHFKKVVSGQPLKRPGWFFDTRQQGEGIVDVTTHLVDMIQWEAFPEAILSGTDVKMLRARRWPTILDANQFQQVTGMGQFPEFLRPDIKDGKLHVYSNGEFTYTLRGVHAKVSVIWKYEAPPGTGDTHYSIMRGTKANLIIRQGADEAYKPVLYVEGDVERPLASAIQQIEPKYPGITLAKSKTGWRISVPSSYEVGHEAHFSQVARSFLDYLKAQSLPTWEVPNMLVKYATILTASAQAKKEG